MEYPFAQAWAALEIYYDRDVEFQPPVSPPALRKIIQAEVARAASKQRALTAGPVERTPPPPWVREWLDGLKKRDEEVLDGSKP